MAELNLDRQAGLSLLLQGKAPGNPELHQQIETGLHSLTDFLSEQYLDTYIPAGGSKIKFVTGLQGSGKTFLAESLLMEAQARNYLTVSVSARSLWLHDFKEIYLEIIRQSNLEEILRGCARQIIRDTGRDPDVIPEDKKLIDYLSEQGDSIAFARSEIRGALNIQFTKNPLLDHTFALCCSLLVGDLLGYPPQDATSRTALLGWMRGEAVKAAQMKGIGISPVKITKQNARHLLRSLCEIIHYSGHPGLLVVIDDLEHLLSKNPDDPIRYTKGKRDDAYESIRQLIDDIDTMRYVLFVMCMDRELMDNENAGLKTYQALWFRVQNEVVSTRFNRFADIIDMDRYSDEIYTEDLLVEMSWKLAEVLSTDENPIPGLDLNAVEQLKARSAFGRLGLPYLVNRMTLEGDKEHV